MFKIIFPTDQALAETSLISLSAFSRAIDNSRHLTGLAYRVKDRMTSLSLRSIELDRYSLIVMLSVSIRSSGTMQRLLSECDYPEILLSDLYQIASLSPQEFIDLLSTD